MRVNHDEGAKELFRYEWDRERIRWFVWTVWENLLYSSYLRTSGMRFQQKWIYIHVATLWARMGNKLHVLGGLSELVMIKSTSNLSLCSHMCHWQCPFIDSTTYIYYWCLEINVINYMFFYIST